MVKYPECELLDYAHLIGLDNLNRSDFKQLEMHFKSNPYLIGHLLYQLLYICAHQLVKSGNDELIKLFDPTKPTKLPYSYLFYLKAMLVTEAIIERITELPTPDIQHFQNIGIKKEYLPEFITKIRKSKKFPTVRLAQEQTILMLDELNLQRNSLYNSSGIEKVNFHPISFHTISKIIDPRKSRVSDHRYQKIKSNLKLFYSGQLDRISDY